MNKARRMCVCVCVPNYNAANHNALKQAVATAGQQRLQLLLFQQTIPLLSLQLLLYSFYISK